MQTLEQILQQRDSKFTFINPERRLMNIAARQFEGARISKTGALVVISKETGRSPKDTYIVRDETTESTVDWSSEYCNAMDAPTFDMLWEDALSLLGGKDRLYICDRVLGADSHYALPVRVATDRALVAAFSDNMFRQVPADIADSCFKTGFELLVLPDDKITDPKYQGLLKGHAGDRWKPEGSAVVAMDMVNRRGIIFGQSYLGTVKKTMFTVMSYLLPDYGVLPLHCSASIGEEGRTALTLGLSGTGKTSLQSVGSRRAIGDDEFGVVVGTGRVFNLEGGCYPKGIGLDPRKEPEIWNAVHKQVAFPDNRVIIENVVMSPRGNLSWYDTSITENIRVSFPLDYLENTNADGLGGMPEAVVMLTYDAMGVLPPISRLEAQQALLWYNMGFTSKVAGTERGVTEPTATFSRFFGEPFMPRRPETYTHLFQRMLSSYCAPAYLVNTGVMGGPNSTTRVPLADSKAMVQAAINGQIEWRSVRDSRFHLCRAVSCQGVDSQILDPSRAWANEYGPNSYDAAAQALAQRFIDRYDQHYADVFPDLGHFCPGKI